MDGDPTESLDILRAGKQVPQPGGGPGGRMGQLAF